MIAPLGSVGGEDLDRDLQPDLGVPGQVDLAHASLPELALDDVVADAGTAQIRHRSPASFRPETV